MDFKSELNNKVAYVNKLLKKFEPAENGYQAAVFEAMNYSLDAGGKRLRPIFMLEVANLFGKPDNSIEAFMAAIEMIHTYSLVHDDLPAMDNDDYRRNKLTTHKKYGHAMGILAGDALLNYAFETVSNALCECSGESLTRSVNAFKILAQKSGPYGMIGGQVVDVDSSGIFINNDILNFVYEKKTSALIEAAFMIGGLLGGADNDELNRLMLAARYIGMAFQIQDDILDVTSTQEMLGKPVFSDDKNNKTTYVTLYGIEKASWYVTDFTDKAMDIIKSFENSNEFLNQLIISLINREK